MGADDDRSDDLDPQDGADETEQHIKAVYELVSDYMDDLDLSESLMAHVLLNAAVNMRMVSYAMETEKPSTGGLRLELDRMRNDFELLVRDSKKGAEDFIATAKAAIADAERRGEDD
jgi:hypothetical protein